MKKGAERQIKLAEIRKKAAAVDPAVGGAEAGRDRLSAVHSAVVANIPVIRDHIERNRR